MPTYRIRRDLTVTISRSDDDNWPDAYGTTRSCRPDEIVLKISAVGDAKPELQSVEATGRRLLKAGLSPRERATAGWYWYGGSRGWSSEMPKWLSGLVGDAYDAMCLDGDW